LVPPMPPSNWPSGVLNSAGSVSRLINVLTEKVSV
jgi:hypothetical protein